MKIFNLNKFLKVIFILSIILFIAFSEIRDRSNKLKNNYFGFPNEMILISRNSDGSIVRVKMDEHIYIIYEPHTREINIIHDPDCQNKKCQKNK